MSKAGICASIFAPLSLKPTQLPGTDIETLQYNLAKLVLWVLAALPLSWLHVMGNFWGWLLSIVPNRAASTTQRNLAVCFPDLPEQQRLGLARESLQHTARSMLEMGKAWMLPIVETRALVREESGVDQLRSTIANKQGVILLAPHLSNWEILGFYVDADMPTSFMYQPPANPAIDRLIREARTRSGIHMAPTSRKGVSQVIKALENGELVGILPDQVPPDGSGVFVPFFGQTAFTMTLVSKLVQRTGAKVFCGFAQRLPHSKGFKVVVKEVMPEFYSSDLEQSVAAMNLSVEELVLMDVVQYQWEYKRFRRQPDDSEFYP